MQLFWVFLIFLVFCSVTYLWSVWVNDQDYSSKRRCCCSSFSVVLLDLTCPSFPDDCVMSKCCWLKYSCQLRPFAEGHFIYNPCIPCRLLTGTKNGECVPAEENKGMIKYLLWLCCGVQIHMIASDMKPGWGELIPGKKET